ncbi:hypothetical protein TSTA_106880 [Talaromyces stipitatus ATCC 10500]|uniref:JmjC domain-containing protein n=1 Tax=Talaromyces stipitatus (strain ATCC 10500 / CBS 375.48 / QM 6759 / NRRL 1006) TaxID=441959 RepID=B8MPN9_TALSN|nr:uncharacterized protein TSTA_106880 [Talaromyces stipitatus ATCC 10500]EED14478.1 hypothetical protein TSTA_106880 [Talaromyces stipitatus ATCC 10500]
MTNMAKGSALAREDKLGLSQSASLVREALKEIQESFGAAFGGLKHCTLYPLDDVPPTVRSLWQSCTTSLPTLYNSSQCWTVRTPLARELVIDALIKIRSKQIQSASEEDFRLNYQGEVNESIDPTIVLAQLVDPDPCCPAFLTGLRSPSVESCGFRCPYDLCTVVEPEEECNIQVNMTPKFSFVDLHIDYGADGLSTLVGDCRKIWLLYPPSEANLRAMKMVDSQRAKLMRIMHQLEGGVIVPTTASHAIYIPAGCIHATFTLQGGFLVAKDFTSSESLTAIASYLLHKLDQTLPSEARSVCYDWFERCLDVCLSSGKLDTALEAWILSQDHLAAWAASHRQWRINVRRLWEQHLHNKIFSDCPCGMQERTTVLSHHVFATHLNFLLPPSQLRRLK